MLRWIVLGFTLLILLTACGPGDEAYHRANAAYARGEYKTAFANYLYAANQGVTPAEYALGYQYFYGQGTPMDQTEAVRWFQRARNHSPRARYALYLINERLKRQPWAFQLAKPTQTPP